MGAGKNERAAEIYGNRFIAIKIDQIILCPIPSQINFIGEKAERSQKNRKCENECS
jgi:hypothetical protein